MRVVLNPWRTVWRGASSIYPIWLTRIAMLRYVDKLTLRPGEMTEADVQALRTARFDDTGIGDITTVTATYAFINHIVDGLGYSLPRGWKQEAITIRAYPAQLPHS